VTLTSVLGFRLLSSAVADLVLVRSMTRLVLTSLVIAASAALAQQPARFRVSIDNFGGHTYRVELRDGQLVYEDSVPKSTSEPSTIAPLSDQWRTFRRALDEIGVWTWHENYEPTEIILDGTSWSLSVWYPDQHVVSGGGNCYPDARGQPTGVPLRTPAFRKFEAAVEALLGGRPFHSDDQTTDR
jgi:hypothetical protein